MNDRSKPNSQRASLVETGMQIFHTRGYTATGVREIASAAGLPQGSFTNHFRSKERFGAEVLDHYAERLDGIMRKTLADETSSPRDRILAYIEAIETSLRQAGWQVGCLIPDMAGEAAAHSDVLRQHLAAALARQTRHFAAVLAESLDEDGAADFAAGILAAWHGTLLRMKVEQTGEPVARFKRFLQAILPDTQVTPEDRS